MADRDAKACAGPAMWSMLKAESGQAGEGTGCPGNNSYRETMK